MTSSKLSALLVTFGIIYFASIVPQGIHGCGMPPAPPPPPPMCCGGPPPSPCGCGGRKKRQAIQPHIKTRDVPCPQNEWRRLMEKAILETDPNGSVQGIQMALRRRFPEEKFLVVCAVANEGGGADGSGSQRAEFAGDTHIPNQIHLSASGDGYCNVVNERIWCQAAAVSA